MHAIHTKKEATTLQSWPSSAIWDPKRVTFYHSAATKQSQIQQMASISPNMTHIPTQFVNVAFLHAHFAIGTALFGLGTPEPRKSSPKSGLDQ